MNHQQPVRSRSSKYSLPSQEHGNKESLPEESSTRLASPTKKERDARLYELVDDIRKLAMVNPRLRSMAVKQPMQIEGITIKGTKTSTTTIERMIPITRVLRIPKTPRLLSLVARHSSSQMKPDLRILDIRQGMHLSLPKMETPDALPTTDLIKEKTLWNARVVHKGRDIRDNLVPSCCKPRS